MMTPEKMFEFVQKHGLRTTTTTSSSFSVLTRRGVSEIFCRLGDGRRKFPEVVFRVADSGRYSRGCSYHHFVTSLAVDYPMPKGSSSYFDYLYWIDHPCRGCVFVRIKDMLDANVLDMGGVEIVHEEEMEQEQHLWFMKTRFYPYQTKLPQKYNGVTYTRVDHVPCLMCVHEDYLFPALMEEMEPRNHPKRSFGFDFKGDLEAFKRRMHKRVKERTIEDLNELARR